MGVGLAKPGDLVTQSLNVLMIAASLILFGNSYSRGKRDFAAGSVLALSAVGFLCLSALWSLAPEMTVRDGIVYLFVILGVIGIARTMDADEFMRLLCRCCFLSAIVSIFLRFTLPGYALMAGSTDGTVDFIGIFAQKNVLGQVMATGSACHFARYQSHPASVSGQVLYVVRVFGNGVRRQVHRRVDGGVAFLRH